jgi:hypothetical protein
MGKVVKAKLVTAKDPWWASEREAVDALRMLYHANEIHHPNFFKAVRKMDRAKYFDDKELKSIIEQVRKLVKP